MILIDVKKEKLNEGFCVGQALEYTIHEACIAQVLETSTTLIGSFSSRLIDVFVKWHLH